MKGSTLELRDSRVTLIEPADPGCLIEFRSSGVLIGRPFFVQIDGEAEGGSIGHGTVTHVAMDRYLTSGVAVQVRSPALRPPRRSGTSRDRRNAVRGAGQAGITVSFAAVARVTGNTVRGMECTGPGCGRDPINEFQSIGIRGTPTRRAP